MAVSMFNRLIKNMVICHLVSVMMPLFECAAYPLWNCLNIGLCYFTSCRANSRLGPKIDINCGFQRYQNGFLITEFYLNYQNFAIKRLKLTADTKRMSDCIIVAFSVDLYHVQVHPNLFESAVGYMSLHVGSCLHLQWVFVMVNVSFAH